MINLKPNVIYSRCNPIIYNKCTTLPTSSFADINIEIFDSVDTDETIEKIKKKLRSSHQKAIYFVYKITLGERKKKLKEKIQKLGILPRKR